MALYWIPYELHVETRDRALFVTVHLPDRVTSKNSLPRFSTASNSIKHLPRHSSFWTHLSYLMLRYTFLTSRETLRQSVCSQHLSSAISSRSSTCLRARLETLQPHYRGFHVGQTKFRPLDADPPAQIMSEDEKKMFEKLNQRFPGGQIVVQDVSGSWQVSSRRARTRASKWRSTFETHHTYFCDVGGCGQFFAIQVIHSDFAGLSTLKQHRIVNQALSDDIKSIHGLQVDSLDSSTNFFYQNPLYPATYSHWL